MRLLVRQARESTFEANLPDMRRPYFALRSQDGRVYRTAERLLPLEGGSNFRDLGGYPGAQGKYVRWGVLFRSAAMPKLTDADYSHLSALQIKSIVDLRSVDERQLAPTEWHAKPGAQYIAIDYPGEVLFSRLKGYNGPEREQVTEPLYSQFPVLLRDEYKAVFSGLLAHKVPLVVQGKRRTGSDRYCGGTHVERTRHSARVHLPGLLAIDRGS
jgi:protein-tyrosine phosphatase